MRRMTLREAQRSLEALPTLVQDSPVAITQRRKPVLVAMSYAHFATMLETLDILSDRPFCHRLAQSIREAQEGRTLDPATVRERLGL